jgi:hypothetical protein
MGKINQNTEQGGQEKGSKEARCEAKPSVQSLLGKKPSEE